MRATRYQGAATASGIILRPPCAAPPSVPTEGEEVAAGVAYEKGEQPQWLRFFFNPHTPLLSAGVWPLRRDFLQRISGGERFFACILHSKGKRLPFVGRHSRTPLQLGRSWQSQTALIVRPFGLLTAERASVPQYPLDSGAVQCWIAHVGVGGFHRSHQCVFYDDLLAKTAAGFPGSAPCPFLSQKRSFGCSSEEYSWVCACS